MGSGPPCGGGRSCRRDVQRSGNLETLWEWRPPTPYRGRGTPGGMRTPRGRPWDPQRGQGTWGAGPLGIETPSWKGTPVQEWGSPPKMGIPLDGLGPPPPKKNGDTSSHKGWNSPRTGITPQVRVSFLPKMGPHGTPLLFPHPRVEAPSPRTGICPRLGMGTPQR